MERLYAKYDIGHYVRDNFVGRSTRYWLDTTMVARRTETKDALDDDGVSMEFVWMIRNGRMEFLKR
jgi:hypothetical protein